MSEAKFVISFNFTTIRGDSYEEFINNLTAVYGEEDGKSLATVAFNDLRNHYVGAPTEGEALQNVQRATGATVIPTGDSNRIVALDVPFKDKDTVKNAGARWDNTRKAWTVPAGHPLTGLFPEKK